MATQVPENQGRAAEAFVNVADAVIKRMNRRDRYVKAITLQGLIASNSHATFRKIGASAGYTPPAGKKAIILAHKVKVNAGGAAEWVGLNDGSTDIGFSSSSAASNLTIEAVNPIVIARHAAAIGLVDSSVPWILKAGRYLQLYSSSGITYCLSYGYEVDLNVTDLDQVP